MDNILKFNKVFAAALDMRRYEEELADYRKKPLLTRMFSSRPVKPAPVFKDSFEAMSYAQEALKKAYPELNGYVPGEAGPSQYKIEMEPRLNGWNTSEGPGLYFKITDTVRNLYSDSHREYRDGYGMIPSYQHSPDEKENKANRYYAADLYYKNKFEVPVLKHTYTSFYNLCFGTMREAMESPQKYTKQELKGIVQDLSVIEVSPKLEILPIERQCDIYQMFGLDDYCLKKIWLEKTIKESLERPNDVTDETRKVFDILSKSTRNYEESGRLFEECVEKYYKQEGVSRPTVNDCLLKGMLTYPEDPTYGATFFLFAGGYSKDIVKYHLRENGLDDSRVDKQFEYVVDKFNSFSSNKPLESMCQCFAVHNLNQDYNQMYVRELGKQIEFRQSQGEKIRDIADELACMGVNKEHFFEVYQKNHILLLTSKKEFDESFEEAKFDADARMKISETINKCCSKVPGEENRFWKDTPYIVTDLVHGENGHIDSISIRDGKGQITKFSGESIDKDNNLVIKTENKVYKTNLSNGRFSIADNDGSLSKDEFEKLVSTPVPEFEKDFFYEGAVLFFNNEPNSKKAEWHQCFMTPRGPEFGDSFNSLPPLKKGSLIEIGRVDYKGNKTFIEYEKFKKLCKKTDKQLNSRQVVKEHKGNRL